MKTIDSMKEQTVDELKVMYRDLCSEIYHLTNELKVHRKLEKPHLLKLKKKNRAQVATVIRQKSETTQDQRA